MFLLYTPWKHQKTKCIKGGIKWEILPEMDQNFQYEYFHNKKILNFFSIFWSVNFVKVEWL